MYSSKLSLEARTQVPTNWSTMMKFSLIHNHKLVMMGDDGGGALRKRVLEETCFLKAERVPA